MYSVVQRVKLLLALSIHKIVCKELYTYVKELIMTAADDKFCDVFFKFSEKKTYYENRLPADDSHEISCLVFWGFF